jgi:hypothetical protein
MAASVSADQCSTRLEVGLEIGGGVVRQAAEQL